MVGKWYCMDELHLYYYTIIHYFTSKIVICNLDPKGFKAASEEGPLQTRVLTEEYPTPSF